MDLIKLYFCVLFVIEFLFLQWNCTSKLCDWSWR